MYTLRCRGRVRHITTVAAGCAANLCARGVRDMRRARAGAVCGGLSIDPHARGITTLFAYPSHEVPPVHTRVLVMSSLELSARTERREQRCSPKVYSHGPQEVGFDLLRTSKRHLRA